MKIVLTTSMAGLGGTETATVRLGRLLRQHGHDIMLASSDGPLLKEAQALGIRWQPVDFYRGGLFGYLKGMIAYARMLRREQPDISNTSCDCDNRSARYQKRLKYGSDGSEQ